MAGEVSNLFWDSCVFYAFLDSTTTHDTSGIEQYLQEARNGQHRIYASSLVFAEVTPNAITKADVGTFQDFIDDMQGAVFIMNPSPDVMHAAAKLKDLPYKKADGKRRLSTTDAIMLASCLEAQDALAIQIAHFHTLDDGKKRGLEGKAVPLISYQDWCADFTAEQMAVAKPVIDLDRCQPNHPHPKLF